MQQLDTAQADVEAEKVDADIEAAADFMKKCKTAKDKAEKLLAEIKVKPDTAPASSDSDVNMVKTAKLPRLELPKFSGNVMDWPSFWDKFTAIVDKSDLQTVSKFTYLQSLLEGEAKSAIHGLSTTADHYVIACDILKERFGKKGVDYIHPYSGTFEHDRPVLCPAIQNKYTVEIA